MIELSEIKLRRVCACTDPERPSTIEIDVLEQIFGLTRLGVSAGTITDVVDESIGVYKQDQRKALTRTRNPVFWLLRFVEWIAQLPFWILSLFGLSQEKTQESKPGQIAKGAFQLAIFVGFAWLLQQVVNALYVLDWLGLKDAALHWLGRK